MAWIEVTNASNRKVRINTREVRSVVTDGSGGAYLGMAGLPIDLQVQESYSDVWSAIGNAELDEDYRRKPTANY